IKLLQELDRNRASKRAATKSCAVQARMHHACYPIGGQQCSKRQSSGQRFCYGDYVGRDPIMLICKILSGTTETTLDLVDQEQCAGFCGQFAGPPKEFLAERVDPAFPLNGFNTHSTNAFIELSIKSTNVIEGNEINPRYKR